MTYTKDKKAWKKRKTEEEEEYNEKLINDLKQCMDQSRELKQEFKNAKEKFLQKMVVLVMKFDEVNQCIRVIEEEG